MTEQKSSGTFQISGKMVGGVAIGAFVLLAIAAYAWHWLTVGQYIQTTNNAYVQSDITPISPKVSGHITQLLVTDNQHVERGDVIARIDNRQYAQQAAGAEAEIERLDAESTALQQRKALQAHMVDQATADVQIAQAELDRAVAELERSQRLTKTGNTSKQNHEIKVASNAHAEGALARAQARLAAAHTEVALLDAEGLKLKALKSRTEAELNVLKLRVEDAVIRAPISGTVGNRSVREGQLVEPGRFLMAIVPLQNIWIDANFKETQLTNVEVGQEVDVEIDTFPGTVIKGVVASVAPASGAEFSILPPQNATGNFTKIVQRIPVKIAIDENDPMIGRLRPGMSSIVSINTKMNVRTQDRLVRE